MSPIEVQCVGRGCGGKGKQKVKAKPNSRLFFLPLLLFQILQRSVLPCHGECSEIRQHPFTAAVNGTIQLGGQGQTLGHWTVLGSEPDLATHQLCDPAVPPCSELDSVLPSTKWDSQVSRVKVKQ